MRTTTKRYDRRAYRVNEFCDAYGISRTSTYEMIKSGELSSVKVAGRRLIPADVAEALLKSAKEN